MPDDDNSLFRKKRIGYGFSPNGVRGWLVLLLIVVAVIAIATLMRR